MIVFPIAVTTATERWLLANQRASRRRHRIESNQSASIDLTSLKKRLIVQLLFADFRLALFLNKRAK